MKRVIFFLSLLPSVLFSQEKYFTLNEVEFDTQVEERLIQKVIEDDKYSIEAFMAISPEDSSNYKDWERRFDHVMEELAGRKIPKKKEKDIKNIYERLHETFLRKYELQAYFDQIFENGVYNCVTAVALYAMSFDRLGISYKIKETPTHVYIVADPEGSQLLIETTDPVSGFKSFSPGFKENFVAQLALMKLVDQNDVAQKGIYKVFDEYYYGGIELSLKELLGAQYYNRGVFYFNDNKFGDAWKALAKAQLFQANDQLDDLLFASIVNQLSGSDYSDWSDISLLPILPRFKSYDVRKTNIIGEFSRMLNYILVEDNDVKKADSAYHFFVSNIENEEIKNEASFIYYYERARLNYNRARYENAFKYAAKAYPYKPGNLDAETMLIESFRISHSNKSSAEGLEVLEKLISEQPVLEENNRVKNLQMNLYLAKMAEDFDSKKATDGNKMKELFEGEISKDPDVIYDQYILADAYSKAAVYYFKRGYTSKARTIVRKGLEYAPGNYELKTRLMMLNR